MVSSEEETMCALAYDELVTDDRFTHVLALVGMLSLSVFMMLL